MVTNGCTGNTLTSTVATLVVNPLTVIQTQPSSTSVCLNASTLFSVNATGTLLSYQWFQNGTATATNTNTLLINTAQAISNGNTYSVVVNGFCNTLTSTVATLTVNPTPVIRNLTDILSETVYQNSVYTLQVSNDTSLNYDWKVNDILVKKSADGYYQWTVPNNVIGNLKIGVKSINNVRDCLNFDQ